MDPSYKATALFLAANLQAAIFIVAGFMLTDYLQEQYSSVTYWGEVVGGGVMLLVARNYYVLLRWVFKKRDHRNK